MENFLILLSYYSIFIYFLQINKYLNDEKGTWL